MAADDGEKASEEDEANSTADRAAACKKPSMISAQQIDSIQMLY